MPVYKAPVEETLFILKDVLDISNFSHIAGYEDMSLEMVEAILEQIAKIAETEMFPLNQVGDAEGCKRQEDGNVITPKGFKEAYNTYCEGGWPGFVTNPKYGGQGLPYCVYSAFSEYVISANNAFTVYPGLTQSAIAAINAHANDALKQMYLPKMIEGKWTGTMNLTEPQCGTDLGLLTTKAIKNENGSYTISGQKIFISSGEHDLAENIVHLVLARVEGAPDGTKGISLFIVPKFEVDEQGELGKRNKVVCGSIEDKMGLHGNATCVMNYDGAIGHLVGEENNGLKAMFKMMNEARLQVAMQGHGQSVIS
ncbi:MAG: acyl-CoA dehydrogenase family protein, partial [Nitratireductor sp.]